METLVIGAGFIGSHIASALAEGGHRVRVLTRAPDAAIPLDGARLLIGEASDTTLLGQALDGVERVIYCAGGLMPADSAQTPVADVSLTLPPLITLLESMREKPAAHLVFLSSGGTVYGAPSRVPVSEEHPTDPVSPYGVLKLASEKYLGLYAALYGVQSQILRCSNVYGEGQPPNRGQGVVAAWLDRILRGKSVSIFGDGSTVRDYLYVRDLAHLIVDLPADGPPLLNVGSGKGTSLNDLLTAIEEVTGRSVQVRHFPARGVDIPKIVLDTTKLRRLTGFKPCSLQVGLQHTWADLLARSAVLS